MTIDDSNMIAMLMAMAMTISMLGVFRDSGVSQESLPFHLTLRGEHLHWSLFWGLFRSKIFQPEIFKFIALSKISFCEHWWWKGGRASHKGRQVHLSSLMFWRDQTIPENSTLTITFIGNQDLALNTRFHSIKAIIIRFHQRSWPTSIMDTINVLKLGNSKPPCSRVCLAANSFWQWLKIISCPCPHQTFLETLFKSKNMSASPQMQTSSKNGALNRIPGLLSQISRLSAEITQIASALSFSG